MHCFHCAKTLPGNVRYCAYCGTPTVSTPFSKALAAMRTVRRRSVGTALLGGALGFFAGGIMGLVLGDPCLGSLAGVVGLAAGGAWSENVVGSIPDRRSAERHGMLFGASGGAVVLVGGMLVSTLVAVWGGRPAHALDYLAFIAGGLYLGLFAALAGAAGGAAVGVLVGKLAARGGMRVIRRRGALLGSVLAWTTGLATGGAIVGHFVGGIVGTDSWQAARIGATVQVFLGVSVLLVARHALDCWRRRGGRFRLP